MKTLGSVYQKQLKGSYADWFNLDEDGWNELVHMDFNEWSILRDYFHAEINRVFDAIPEISLHFGLERIDLRKVTAFNLSRLYYQMIYEKYHGIDLEFDFWNWATPNIIHDTLD